jgi:hypothetical protein
MVRSLQAAPHTVPGELSSADGVLAYSARPQSSKSPIAGAQGGVQNWRDAYYAATKWIAASSAVTAALAIGSQDQLCVNDVGRRGDAVVRRARVS